MILPPVKLIIAACFPLSLAFIIKANPANANHAQYPLHLISEVSIVEQSTDLLKQGKQYYQDGRYAAAVNLFKQAVSSYQSKQAEIPQAQALNYLATAHQALGQWQEAQTAITKSLELVPVSGKTSPTALLLRGQALTQQGKLQLSLGQPETAYKTWQQARVAYEQADDDTGQLIAALNQAQALQTMGQYRQARLQLEDLVAKLKQQPDSLLKAQGLRSLGVALQTTGDLEQSKTVLEASLAISQTIDSQPDISAANFAIGNVAKDFSQYDVAWAYYQEVVESSPDPITSLQAQLNQLRLLVEFGQWQPAADLIPAIEQNLTQLQPSRQTIYSYVNLAEQIIVINYGTHSTQSETAFNFNANRISQLLVTAIQQARQIKDPRAEAFALNQLGDLYQRLQQISDAEMLTEIALKLAQEINADDIIARAATRLGSIRKLQRNIPGAIAAYDVAFKKLQQLRSDLVSVSAEAQFTFKDSIEPTYRDYVDVLLTEDGQENLQKARQVMEALQLAELDNFFQDACLDSYPVIVDDIDVQAAVIYPIILSDRLEVILSLPQQPLRHYSTPLPRAQIETTLQEFYSSLSPGYPRNKGQDIAQELYNLLIKPAEAVLQRNNSQTLVFVPDGFFRNLPISALYDGERYLIEKYSIAISPGLQLFPEGLRGKELSLLAVGLTEARQGFNSLPGVAAEVEQLSDQIDAQVLLNQDFTRDRFSTVLDQRPYPVVHLATHGQFSSDPKETFLLSWSDRISIQDFDRLFQKRMLGQFKPIELLVMSACQTAAGDNRAALGLAGFALRSGARSTIASLWSVNDQATSELMRAFYTQLIDGGLSKAEALRQAQIKVLSDPLYQHPNFWSAFVLVGNWL